MTPDQIRDREVTNGSPKELAEILVEIAAQLAEINENLKAIETEISGK